MSEQASWWILWVAMVATVVVTFAWAWSMEGEVRDMERRLDGLTFGCMEGEELVRDENGRVGCVR